jgi:CDGSH-type Zn-finger protein
MNSNHSKNTIEVTSDGPLVMEGEIHFLDPDEQAVFTKTSVALCRCGHSKDKPFCDGSHEGACFSHSANTLEGKYGEAATEPGHVSVEPLANGPLFVTGSFCLISSDGKTICHGNKTVLCRCGLSENKPFCDGSHRAGAFEAPTLGN